MPRLIDYALSSIDRSLTPSFVKNCLRDSITISIDNVYKYIEASGRGFGQKDIPNIAPPFNNFFMEYHRRFDGDTKNSMIGQLFYINLCADIPYADLNNIKDDTFREFLKKQWHRGRWLYSVNTCCLSYLEELAWISETFFLVDENGIMVDEYIASHERSVGFQSQDSFKDFVNKTLMVSLLAISFMHCKNVTTEEVTPNAPVSKKYQKKHGVPLEKYYILNIEPMKKVLRTEGNSEKTGIKQALHICRGHFKDFSQGNGLFGKFKGLYWWDSSVRGSHQNGIIDKDYSVKSK